MTLRGGRRPLPFLALLAVVASWGCASSEKFDDHMQTGDIFYRNRKWKDATQQFMMAVEENPSSTEAKLSLAYAGMEYGNDLYLQADRRAAAGDRGAVDAATEAGQFHEMSAKMFSTVQKDWPSKMNGWYGMGLLHYGRVASGLRYPYGPGKDAESEQTLRKLKAEEVEKAIASFRKVLALAKDSYYSHRYLGILLFSRGVDRFRVRTGMSDSESATQENHAKADLSKGREHLLTYHDAVHVVIERSSKRSVRTAEEKKKLRELLTELENDLEQVKRLLSEYHYSVAQEESRLQMKRVHTEADSRWKGWLATERLATDAYIKKFSESLSRTRTIEKPEETPEK